MRSLSNLSGALFTGRTRTASLSDSGVRDDGGVNDLARAARGVSASQGLPSGGGEDPSADEGRLKFAISGRSVSDHTLPPLLSALGGLARRANSSEVKARQRSASASSSPSPQSSAETSSSALPAVSQRGTTTSPESLASLLSNSDKAAFFKRFLEGEHADENLLFWLAVEKYRRRPDEDLAVEARRIVVHHLDDAGAKQIFLPPPMRRVSARTRHVKLPKLKKDRQETKTMAPHGVVDISCSQAIFEQLEHAPRTLFDAAQLEIANAMAVDNYGRFCESMLYEAMSNALENKSALVDPVVFSTFLRYCSVEGKKLLKLTSFFLQKLTHFRLSRPRGVEQGQGQERH